MARKYGKYQTFIAMAVTEGEKVFEVTKVRYWGSRYRKRWDGTYPPGHRDEFYDFETVADGFEFWSDAETEMLLLTARRPDLIGKVFVTTKWVPETMLEKQERLKRARELRARRKAVREAWKVASGGSSEALDSTQGSTPSDTGITSKNSTPTGCTGPGTTSTPCGPT